MRLADTAVEEADLRMRNGSAERFRQHRGRDRKDQIILRRHCPFKRACEIIACVVAVRHDIVLRDLVNIQSAGFMGVDPAGAFDICIIDKSDAQRGCGSIPLRAGEQRSAGRDFLIGRLRHEFDRVGIQAEEQLSARHADIADDRFLCILKQRAHREDRNINEECITHCGFTRNLHGGGAFLNEAEICGLQILTELLAPALAELLTENIRELFIGMRLREDDMDILRRFVEFQIFVIDNNILVVCALRHDARYIGEDEFAAAEFGDRNALVALLHIILVHEFIDLDRVADALAQIRGIER